MNTRSIKFRLTFWYSLATLTSIAIIFSSFYFTTEKILFTQTDNVLISHAKSIIEASGIPPQTQYNEVPGMLIQFLDGTSPEKYQIKNQIIGNTKMRVFTQKLENYNKVILVAHPIDAIENSLKYLSITLIFAFILLMIPTIFIGNMISAKVIKYILADIAHELKTPLAIIRSNIEVGLSKERSREEYKKILNETLEDSIRASQSLKSVLEDVINFSDMIDGFQEIASKMSFQKQIKIISRVESKILIQGNQEKLFRAIINILDNAVKYSPQKSKINISLIKKSGKAILTITDQGIGITQKDIPFIFERFYRGSKTDKSQGSGIGLSIAKNTIDTHHGTIEVNSKPGVGTTFKISLPLMKS